MSMLEELRGKGKVFKSGSVEFEIQQLSVDELAEFVSIQEKKDLKKAIKYLIETSLKKSVEGVTDEEINNLDTGVVMELITFLMKLNGMEGDVSKKEGGSVKS